LLIRTWGSVETSIYLFLALGQGDIHFFKITSLKSTGTVWANLSIMPVHAGSEFIFRLQAFRYINFSPPEKAQLTSLESLLQTLGCSLGIQACPCLLSVNIETNKGGISQASVEHVYMMRLRSDPNYCLKRHLLAPWAFSELE
jgi:hypothetical protein